MKAILLTRDDRFQARVADVDDEGLPEGDVTLGVDYWLAPNAVLKFAYEFDDRKVEQSQDAFLVQFGIGL